MRGWDMAQVQLVERLNGVLCAIYHLQLLVFLYESYHRHFQGSVWR